MSAPAVIVMAKAPRAGEAKSRLAPPLTPEEAARLAACMFADTVSNALGVGAVVVVAYAPADGRAALEEVLRGSLTEETLSGVLWLEQYGEDISERGPRGGGAGVAFSIGFGPLLFVGADSPTLPPSCLAAALEMFRRGRADVALGPTE